MAVGGGGSGISFLCSLFASFIAVTNLVYSFLSSYRSPPELLWQKFTLRDHNTTAYKSVVDEGIERIVLLDFIHRLVSQKIEE
jgi:hypothetical protein